MLENASEKIVYLQNLHHLLPHTLLFANGTTADSDHMLFSIILLLVINDKPKQFQLFVEIFETF